jgi:hypothetical protein
MRLFARCLAPWANPQNDFFFHWAHSIDGFFCFCTFITFSASNLILISLKTYPLKKLHYNVDLVPTLEQRHKRVWYERIAISYIFIFMTDFKSQKAQKSVVWKDCNFIHFHIHDRFQVTKVTKECGVKGLQFHTFSYSWQISSHKRHKRVLCERIAISYIFIFMTDFKSQKAQKSVVWRDCNFTHFHIHDRCQVPKGTEECGVKGLQFHTFSYSWQISSHKRHKRVWGERIAISYIVIFMTNFTLEIKELLVDSIMWLTSLNIESELTQYYVNNQIVFRLRRPYEFSHAQIKQFKRTLFFPLDSVCHVLGRSVFSHFFIFPIHVLRNSLILFYSSVRPVLLPAWWLVLEMNLNERLWIMGFIKGLSWNRFWSTLYHLPFQCFISCVFQYRLCTATYSSLIKASFVTTVLI